MKHLKQWLTLAAAAALALGLLTGCDWFGTEQPSDSVPPSSSPGQDNNATPPPPTQPSLDNVTAEVDGREYTVGQSFDPASLTVTLHFDDGTETEINGNQLTGLSWAPETFEDKDIGENTTVTLTYEDLTAEVTVTVKPGPASPGYVSDGNYSIDEQGNYTVESAVGLEAWATAVRGGKAAIDCTLTSDITLTGDWTAVGYYPTEYVGTFDGQGHSIQGLQVTTNDPAGASAALFHTIAAGGTVKNLQLVDVDLEVQSNGVAGGIAANNYGSITACSVTGTISAANGAAGGIAANNGSGTITGCWFSGTVQGDQNNGSGGIVCYNLGKVNACYWDGTADKGIGENQFGGSGTVTKVDGQTVTWQSAAQGMNAALGSSGYQWSSTGGLPTLTSGASGSSLLRGLDTLTGLFS